MKIKNKIRAICFGANVCYEKKMMKVKRVNVILKVSLTNYITKNTQTNMRKYATIKIAGSQKSSKSSLHSYEIQ